jgi:hypothetical protein
MVNLVMYRHKLFLRGSRIIYNAKNINFNKIKNDENTPSRRS